MMSLLKRRSGQPHTRVPRAGEKAWLDEQRAALKGLTP